MIVTALDNGFVRSSKNVFTLSHLNTRSLKSKIEDLRIYMSDCDDVVMGISESWLEDIVPSHVVDIQG